MNFTLSILDVSLILFLLSFSISLIFFFVDKSKKRVLKNRPPLSVLIPCYNDGESIEYTIRSLYDSYPTELIELFVINDKSTDNSLEIIKKLQKEFSFQILDNEINKGKTESLNLASGKVTNDLMMIVDADVILNPKSIEDMLARLQDDKTAAVSCPYAPQNKGFFPLMQSIEYNMLLFIQGAYNIDSALTIWGGCILFKKEIFEKVGRFSHDMLTEDIDLAYKINKAGYKVHQSFYSISTFVPETFQVWFKQKLRWNGGGFQCSLRYPLTWIKNPLHLISILSFNLMMLGFIRLMIDNIIFINFMMDNPTLVEMWRNVISLKRIFWGVLWKIGFTCFALPYVLPLIKSWKDFWKIIFVVPYSLIYVPLYVMVSIGGIFYGLKHYPWSWKGKKARAW